MPTWSELIDEIAVHTKRPDLVERSNIALRQAVRIAHRSDKYWRDLTSATVTLALTEIQTIDLSSAAPRFRAMSSLVSSANPQLYYEPLDAADLLDQDGYYKTNVYWGFGATLKLRAAAPEAQVVLNYYQYPIVSPTSSFNSWIADEDQDLLTMLAASNVLASIGEQEIKSRLDALVAIKIADLKQDNLEVQGR